MTENFCMLLSRNRATALKTEMVIKGIGVEVLSVRSLLMLKNELAAQSVEPMFVLVDIENSPEDVLLVAGVKEVIGDTPILVLGNEPRRDYLLEMLQAGTSDFLVKPLDERLASEKVKKALQKQLEAGPHLTEAARNMLRIELAKARKGKYALSVGLLSLHAPGMSNGFELEQRYRRDVPAVFDALAGHFFETDLRMMIGINHMLVILPFCSGEQRSVFSDKVTAQFGQFQAERPAYKEYSLIQAYQSEFEHAERPDRIFDALLQALKETRKQGVPA